MHVDFIRDKSYGATVGRSAGQGTFRNCESLSVPSGAVVRLVLVPFARDSIFE
jgi:hypothetical protein